MKYIYIFFSVSISLLIFLIDLAAIFYSQKTPDSYIAFSTTGVVILLTAVSLGIIYGVHKERLRKTGIDG